MADEQTLRAKRYYPLTSYHFQVEFINMKTNEKMSETSFQEVGGLTVEVTAEELQEGGVNDYSHRLPGKTKYGNLVLKRGSMGTDSKLIKWVLDAVKNRTFDPMHVYVSLLNEKHDPVISWQFFRAWPVKLVSSDLKATDSSIAIETLELSFSYMDRVFNTTPSS